MHPEPLTVLAIATYRKGDEFLRECRRQGCRVLLLTEEKLRDADWPREAIDGFFYLRREMSEAELRKGLAHAARTERIDRIVALDDFDVELAAALREYLQLPGMGISTALAFRDKLAMRTRARALGVPCPAFVHAVNRQAIDEWCRRALPPWVLKPRFQAASVGIRKLNTANDVPPALDALGDEFGDFLLEQFIPGDVFHVDSIVSGAHPVLAVVSRYGAPPMSVVHDGGIFITRTLPEDDPAVPTLRELNGRILTGFGLQRGASHTEFIRSGSGDWYFLETSARVGGAFIVDMVDAATGVNLWREWARVEIAGEHGPYEPPAARTGHAGIILSLARQEEPDTSAYDAPEIVTRLRKRHHAGLIVASPDPQRVQQLLDDYVGRFYRDFHASAPAPDRPTE